MQLEDYFDALDRIKAADREGRFVISIVADLLGVHAQTLRHYERMGLVEPARSRGNIRLYSQRDLELLRTIVRLTGELGVNLIGVEIILKLRRRIAALEAEVDVLHAERRSLRGLLLEDHLRRE